MRRFYNAVLVLVLVVLAGGAGSNAYRNPQPSLVAEGVALTQPERARLDAWVRTGRLPRSHPDMVRRALIDLKTLTLPSGAALAGWDGPWRFVWPRDASFVAAAFCAAGFYEDAARVFTFLYAVRPATTGSPGADQAAALPTGDGPAGGRWAARYLPDGSAPVRDGRDPQLDGSGWLPWSVWFCATRWPDPVRSDQLVRTLWPMLRQSADQVAAELGPDGLPAPSQDYWERDEKAVTLGTVAPLLAGLRSTIQLATRHPHHRVTTPCRPTTLSPCPERSLDGEERWREAEGKLATAVEREFGSRGFPRSRLSGADAIVTVLGPPFAPARPEVTAAIERSRGVLTVPNGGVTPGEDWRADGVAWTPQTTLFALSAAARGDRAQAESILDWLAARRTSTGSLPEKVNRDGHLAGEAPLAWTSALVVLTAAALDEPLPVPSFR